MRLPSKVTTYKQSIIAKFPIVLDALKKYDIAPDELYAKVKTKINNVDEYIEVLECLYVLGKIDYLEEQELITYVERNIL